MLQEIIMIIGGVFFLFTGGEAILKGSLSLARIFKLSGFLVSAVIIGFGTSLPEFSVSMGAAMSGSPDIALGNVIGSNISNIFLIIGVSCLVSPLRLEKCNMDRDIAMMVFSALVLSLLSYFSLLNYISGALMLIALIGYIFLCYKLDRVNHSKTTKHLVECIELEQCSSIPKAFVYSIGGLLFLLLGSWLMVQGATSIARILNISEAIIGLSAVAIATSLPELSTAIIASYKKHSDIILGNILGSNVFNCFFVIGATSIIQEISVADRIAKFDVWIMLAASIFFGVLLKFFSELNRLIGVIFLTIHVLYISWLYTVI